MTKLSLPTVLLLTMVLLPSAAFAQAPALTGAAKWADSAAREIDRASIAGDLDRLRAARTLIDRALVAFPNDPLLLHYEGYELYREANMLDGLRRSAEVPPLMEKARVVLEQSSSAKAIPETHALLSSILGRLIGADPSLGMSLGPASQGEMMSAVSTGPTNPRVWMLRGVSSMFTPVQWGGGLPAAEAQLRKAIEFFATDKPVPPAPSWGNAEAYVWLGQVLQRQNKPADALVAYNNALALEPNYTWVKMVLVPSVRK
ncbi:MAG: tetratricopeptide repeat protein [Gemmatimonadota bacterium]|nr:tetratricopeptide repeat protein [Gemmatimonadota bacterium]